MTAILLAEKSDFLGTLPSGAAQALDHRSGLSVLQPPIELPTFDVKLYWHERFHNDPAHIWLRNVIYGLFEDVTDILDQDIV